MENVRVQLNHFKQLTLIRNMSRKGKTLRLHGSLCRVETGKTMSLLMVKLVGAQV
jgi:carbonic anhydrase